MSQLDLRPVPLEETRKLRRDVLRPYLSVDELAATEPGGAVAFGVFEGDALLAVGLVGPDGEPGDWRVRGMATAPHARGRGAGTKVLQALVQYATDNGATRVWCNARTPARSLYERAGFVATSDELRPRGSGRTTGWSVGRPAADRVPARSPTSRAERLAVSAR